MQNPLLAIDLQMDLHSRISELEHSWEQFVGRGSMPDRVRPQIVESWSRCRARGINPGQTEAPVSLTSDEILHRWKSHPLHDILSPLLPALECVASDAGQLVAVTGADGMMLYQNGSHAAARQAERVGFVPGGDWSELHVGTNAIGTALATGNPIQILAAEHFVQVSHQWTCSAAPVRDPSTGEILGAIDLSGMREAVHPYLLASVISTARAAEEQLLRRRECLDLVVQNEYLGSIARDHHGAYAAVDSTGRVLLSTPRLAEMRLLDFRRYLSTIRFALLQQEPGEREMRITGPEGDPRTLLLKPVWRKSELAGYVVRVVEQGSNRESVATKYNFGAILGESSGARTLVQRARQAAAHAFPVLLLGESGTGKEMVAQSIHAASSRRRGPFVAVNCAAIPPELLASELFGYEGGSFTGAKREGHPGKFEQASGGTLFLDEIGDMPANLQAHLLRVLEEQQVIRIGGLHPITLDVRVIAATHTGLEERVQAGQFRADLFYRIAVTRISLPPLRERRGDIPELMRSFLARARSEMVRPPLELHSESVRLIQGYSWPGNIRELRNLAVQLAVDVADSVILPEHLPAHVRSSTQSFPEAVHVSVAALHGAACQPEHPTDADDPAGQQSLHSAERELILRALAACDGNVTEAARRLKIHRSTIYRRLREEP